MAPGERRRLGEWGSALEDDSIFTDAGSSSASLAGGAVSVASSVTYAIPLPLQVHTGLGRGATPASLPTTTTTAAAPAPAAAALPAPPASVAAIKAKLLHDKEARLAQEEAERAKKERLALALAVPKVRQTPTSYPTFGPFRFLRLAFIIGALAIAITPV
jgi:hypothetical protein